VAALGADEVVLMTDAVAVHAGTLHFLLSTIPTQFDLKPYINLLKHDATMVSVGLLEPTPPRPSTSPSSTSGGPGSPVR
jgi:uncharacterized zinc-type alcohol dehydrogenase-like protein